MKMTMVTQDVLAMCEAAGLDGATVYKKSQMLLKCYRRICFAARRRANELKAEADFCGADLQASLVYLNDFAPDIEKERFETSVESLFDTYRLVKLVDEAMAFVFGFYTRGELYHQLLSKAYLTHNTYRVTELADILQLEESVFYLRRQEAVLVFGYALWAIVLPYLQEHGWGATPAQAIHPATQAVQATSIAV